MLCSRDRVVFRLYNGLWYGKRERDATKERALADSRDAVGQVDVAQHLAPRKGLVADAHEPRG
eukprot:m.467292 g.467292  ORF g.467292 m.467292 type:complete len:63 (+) comp26152_c0_seq1:72-260(+)